MPSRVTAAGLSAVSARQSMDDGTPAVDVAPGVSPALRPAPAHLCALMPVEHSAGDVSPAGAAIRRAVHVHADARGPVSRRHQHLPLRYATGPGQGMRKSVGCAACSAACSAATAGRAGQEQVQGAALPPATTLLPAATGPTARGDVPRRGACAAGSDARPRRPPMRPTCRWGLMASPTVYLPAQVAGETACQLAPAVWVSYTPRPGSWWQRGLGS